VARVYKGRRHRKGSPMKRLVLSICALVVLAAPAAAQTLDSLFVVVDPRSQIGVGIIYDFLGQPYSTSGLLLVPEKFGPLATVDDITDATEGLASQAYVAAAVQDALLSPTVACANDGQSLGGSCDNVCTKSVVAQIADESQCQVATADG